MKPFENPDADVVEVHHRDRVDLVALVGKHQLLAYVSIAGGPNIALRRRRPGLWRCDEHGFATPACQHIYDVGQAVAHLANEQGPPPA